MKSKTKRLIAAVLLLSAVIFFALTIGAAYYGKGMLKDVFVNGQNYFSSDVLASVPAADGVGYGNVLSGGNEKTILFFNHNRSTGEYNMYDITFAVYLWLDSAAAGKTCVAECGGVTAEITAAEKGAEPAFRATLAGGTASTCALTVRFGAAAGEELSTFPGVFVAAVPEQPKYLSAKVLGGRIVPFLNDSFSVDCGFEDAGSAELAGLAAFPYTISIQGEPPAGEKLRILWDSAKLTIAPHSLPSGVTPEAYTGSGEYDTCIVLPETADAFIRLVFLRVQDLPEEETNIWESGKLEDGTLIDWNVLAGFVASERITGGE